MILTTTHSSNAETNHFDHNTFQPCWRFSLHHISTKLKLSILTMAHSSNAETGDFDHNTLQAWLNRQF
jgi:hypothetical protein